MALEALHRLRGTTVSRDWDARCAIRMSNIILRDAQNAKVLNDAAWILAVFKRVPLHDPMRAKELATKACELTQYKSAASLDTLACAHAA